MESKCESCQDGEGIAEIIDAVKKKFQNGDVEIFKSPAAAFMRKGGPPKIREWMKRPAVITRLIVCRKPIFKVLQKILDFIPRWLKGGSTYDEMMHLFMVIYLSDGTVWRLEKNQVLNLVGPLSEAQEKELTNFGNQYNSDQVGAKVGKVESRVFPINPVTPADLISKALEKVGPQRLFVYDARNPDNNSGGNCQRFVMDILSANGPVSGDLKAFILQDAQKALDSLGILGSAMRAITDGAAAADRVLNGEGMQHGGEISGKQTVFTLG